MSQQYRTGELVVYHKTKHSVRPGPRAQNISPAPLGDGYSYEVDKFWIVVAIEDKGIVLRTRRGKEHTVTGDDPNLRHARWWERLIYRSRFPQLDEQTQAAPKNN